MISFGPMSITLSLGAAQGVVLAVLLIVAPRNRVANRYLALLIVAVALLITPFIIGYAGFYDKWPQLSFAPFSYTLAFGPLIYFYTVTLVDRVPRRIWLHFLPVLVQFLADALIFPLPLATKDWWDGFAHAPIISPAFEVATLISIATYGTAAFRHYRDYRYWLDTHRTDGIDFDPSWIRNFLIALAGVAIVWLGFQIANWRDPSRNYFDQFWLYVTFSVLVIYFGVAGWRHADTGFPTPVAEERGEQPAEASDTGRDWDAQGQFWLNEIDQNEYWRDPELTLSSLARKLGTNTAYLSRGLNEAAGENFKAIINRRRVAAVQQRLSSPSESRDMLAVGFDAGFSSKASFNRAFVAFAGMSPSAWRLKSQKLHVAAEGETTRTREIARLAG